MAVVYDEGREVVTTRESVVVTRTLRVTPYSEVGYVTDLLLGGARLVGGFLFRIPPARDPWLPWCIASEVRQVGVGAYTGTAPSNLNNLAVRASYSEGARLIVTYRTLGPWDSDYDPLGNEEPPGQPGGPPTGNPQEPTNQQEMDLASVTYDFGVRTISSEDHILGVYASQPGIATTADEKHVGPVTKYIPRLDAVLTRHFVLRVPWTAITRLLGKVNKSNFQTAYRVIWPKGTLRFDGLHAARKVTSFGAKMYELQYRWAIMPVYDQLSDGGAGYVGWQRQYMWRGLHAGKWAWIADTKTGKLLYEWDEGKFGDPDDDGSGYSQTLNGVVVRGFKLLFHPRAT